jgi:protease-4
MVLMWRDGGYGLVLMAWWVGLAGTCLAAEPQEAPKPVVATEADKPSTEKPATEKPPKPKRLSVAHIGITGALSEGTQPAGLFGEVTETLDSLLQRLRKAGEDDKVHAVLLHIQTPAIGWGKVHEIRAAVSTLRAKGKRVIAFTESTDTHGYLIAAACDTIVLPESGLVSLPGVRAEVTFYKNLFDWLEVQPQMLRVGEYKSAAEPYTRSEMSPEFREEMTAVLDGFYELIVSSISESRKLDLDKVRAIIDRGVLTAAAAKEAGLVDLVAYEDAIPALIKGDDATAEVRLLKGYGKRQLDTDFSGITGMVKMMNLLMGVEEPQRKSTAQKIALISAVGPIMSGPSSFDLFGESTMGSDTMIKAIRQARDDDTVVAIVLRVDSPGGSALASDLMWHELETVKKPVVVSMGDVAASGGYYIAMGADKIFAEPGTITGSIGVVGGKLALEKTFAKFGVTTSVVQRGANAGLESATSPFTDSERAITQELMNSIYAQFTMKAAQGRKMDVETLEKLARGRIYTGTQAKALGLIDEVGTLADAIAFAKTAAGLDPAKKLERLDLPKAVSPFEQLLGPIEPETRARFLAETWWSALPEGFRQPLRQLQTLELLAREPALTILPYQLRVR